MATNQTTAANKNADKPARTRREPKALGLRMKDQLTTAALKGNISADELEALGGHIAKLKGLVEA